MSSDASILTTRIPKPSINLVSALARASQLTERSPTAIAVEVIGAMLGRRKFGAPEFFVQGAWNGDAAERAAYLGNVANLRLNRSLIGPGTHDQTALLNDKYLAGLVLQANGFPVPEIRAVYSPDRAFGTIPTLESAAALTGWINDASHLPVFAKPVDGSMALGSVPLMPAEAKGQVDIGGRVVDSRALAEDVARNYPRGWLLQEQLRQPDEVEAYSGSGIGTVRVVTLWEEAGPQVLYGVWRHPAVGTWVDAAIHGKPNVGCALAPDTGAVVRAHLGDLFTGREISHSLVTPGLPLIGYRVPGWAKMVAVCRDAHRLFPGHAVLGWDVAITRRGPVLSEVNMNPLHMSYQRAFRRGFLHAEFMARLDAARSLLKARVQRYSARGTPA